MSTTRRASTLLLFTLLLTSAGAKGNILNNNNDIYPHSTVEISSDVESKATLGDDLDKYYSNKKLGSFVQDGKTYFRLFAPRAEKVLLCTTPAPLYVVDKEFAMTKDKDGVWEVVIDDELYGTLYAYKVYNPENKNQVVPLCFDPYSKAIASFNTYMNPRRSIVVKEGNYNWGEDEWIKRDWRDVTVYEMHVRDMTAHPTSMANEPGTYKGLVEKGRVGGIDYIKSLGVNTVELLPAQEFGNYEIPYKDSLEGRFNTWNPYGRNHWGYMTAGYFAPESYYSEGTAGVQPNTWKGTSGKQVTDFKDMVKAFHKENIAVVMDVVYNHFSEYEQGGLKQIDQQYYFRLNADGTLKAESGCGNDLKTERPMVRKMIVESILYWMKEYHVDGFRFDLGKLLDWETISEIIKEARKINPAVIFVCEPWGGGYDPNGFSVRGWGAWNDQIRNGIKGENPNNGLGWIFGKWFGNNNPERIKSYVNGTLTRDSLGLFVTKEHSVNYLESHDGLTLGDFIRLATKEVTHETKITDPLKAVKLSESTLKLHKLAAMFLFTSQGMTMIHEGQEFARTKVVPADIIANDPLKGKIDENTYDKDNPTNYIDYRMATANADLVEYYKGLIKIRNEYSAFRRAGYEDITFFTSKSNEFAISYIVKHDTTTFMVLFNANSKISQTFNLPEGNWQVIADADKAGLSVIKEVAKSVDLQPTTGLILKLKKK